MIEITPDNALDAERIAESATGSTGMEPENSVATQERVGRDIFLQDQALGDGAESGIHEANVVDMSGDGVALRIMEPRRAGTLMVAVAEPTDDYYDQAPSCESEAFRAEQETAAPLLQPSPDATVHSEIIIPHYEGLVELAAVRLDGLGPAFFFTTNGVACSAGSKVIVSMEEGLTFGEVASVMHVHPDHLESMADEDRKIRPLSHVATEKDVTIAENNRALAMEALEYCRGCIRERELDMKLVDVLILHDRSKMVFYFTAPARIDFRELVKDLVRRYRTRIELRQIGVRHETQMVGALGNCGMVCCCRRYLRKFAPVAIKMAKEQNVFLNPVKISGVCGRLLCCLAYEQEHYDEFYRSCPKLGKKYQTDAGMMRVLRASLFRESVTVLSETGEEVEYPLSDWNGLHPFRPAMQQQPQHPPKAEPQGGEGKPRKGGGRNAQPSAQANRQERSTPPAERVGAEVALNSEGRKEVKEAPSAPVAANTVRNSDVFRGKASEQGNAQTFDDVDDSDDGSIFGLAPGRDRPSASEGDAAKPGQRDGARHKWPRRRKPHGEQ